MSAERGNGGAAFAEVKISKMTEKDLVEVLKIEEISFSTPWSKGMFVTELRDNPFANLLVARPPAPAHAGGNGPQVLGYCCFWIIFGEVHIMNLAVHPDWRRKGIASRLVERTLSMSRDHMVKKVHLEVRKSNELAKRIYEKFGFRVVSTRPNYYAEPREDAVIMLLEME